MESQTFLFYAIGAIIGTAIAAWIFALIFSMSKQVKIMQIQVGLLIQIAQKAGVTSDEIQGIINTSYPYNRPSFLGKTK